MSQTKLRHVPMQEKVLGCKRRGPPNGRGSWLTGTVWQDNFLTDQPFKSDTFCCAPKVFIFQFCLISLKLNLIFLVHVYDNIN